MVALAAVGAPLAAAAPATAHPCPHGNAAAQANTNVQADAGAHGNAGANADAGVQAGAEQHGNGAHGNGHVQAGAKVNGNAGAKVHGNAGAKVHGNAGAKVHGNAGAKVRGNAGANGNGKARGGGVERVSVTTSEEQTRRSRATAHVHVGNGLQASLEAHARAAAREVAREEMRAHVEANGTLGAKAHGRGAEISALVRIYRTAYETGGWACVQALLRVSFGNQTGEIPSELAKFLASIEQHGAAGLHGNGNGSASVPVSTTTTGSTTGRVGVTVTGSTTVAGTTSGTSPTAGTSPASGTSPTSGVLPGTSTSPTSGTGRVAAGVSPAPNRPRSVSTGTSNSGQLPFTGADLPLLAAIGAMLLALGVFLRRLTGARVD